MQKLRTFFCYLFLTSTFYHNSWEAPLKNPQTVYLYRVFWRALGAKVPEKLDTSETSVVLTGLQDDVRYECVVKAANDVGEYTVVEDGLGRSEASKTMRNAEQN